MPHISHSRTGPGLSSSSIGEEEDLDCCLECGAERYLCAQISHRWSSSTWSSLMISVMCNVAALGHFWHFIAAFPVSIPVAAFATTHTPPRHSNRGGYGVKRAASSRPYHRNRRREKTPDVPTITPTPTGRLDRDPP